MCVVPLPVGAWSSDPHRAITRGAIAALPKWQRERLGQEMTRLAEDYCLIPDHVYTHKDDAKFAMMDSHPGKTYLLFLHLPEAQQAENLETLRYFMQKVVADLEADRVQDAAKHLGTLCHVVEDFGSPSHTVPGDNQFTLIQQFLPPPESMRGVAMHSAIESGSFAVDLGDYRPRLLGTTLEEAAWRLLHRLHEVIVNARATTLPIIQALYAGDAPAVLTHQMRAATLDAQVVADMVYTLLSISENKIQAIDAEALRRVDIAGFFPVEAAHLYYPQSHYFSSPYWGHARVGHVLEGGTKAGPIRLRVKVPRKAIPDAPPADTAVEDQVKEKDTVEACEIARAISTGSGRPLTFLLPPGIYSRFTVLAGLQAGLGDSGRVEFIVTGDGKALTTATVDGGSPAYTFDCEITGVRELKLEVQGRGLNPKSNYAIWAEPVLAKP